MKGKNSKCHLCLSCVYDYPECSPKKLEFGEGDGHDNVIECDAYQEHPMFKENV